jgi:protein-S-isoprenylcysteine O-methyltransferase Ste14
MPFDCACTARLPSVDFGVVASEIPGTIHGPKAPSLPQKCSLAGIHLVVIAVVAWLLLAGGIHTLAGWLGTDWTVGNAARRALLFACSLIYFLRLLPGTFVFLKRRIAWGEVAIVAPWIAVIQIAFALLGGTRQAPLGAADAVAVALYALGSYLNTGSEYLRYVWKQRPENRGRLYTQGLFRYAMHINYFGDLVLFSGFALLTRSVWAGIIPLIMLAGFVFFNIPALDGYLRRKYGPDFEAYARRTSKLVPFLY